MVVGHGVAEAVGRGGSGGEVLERRARRVGRNPAGAQCDAALGCRGGQAGHAQHVVAVHVAHAGQQPDRHRLGRRGRRRIVRGYRRLVHPGDGDRGHRRGGSAMPVRHGVGERVGGRLADAEKGERCARRVVSAVRGGRVQRGEALGRANTERGYSQQIVIAACVITREVKPNAIPSIGCSLIISRNDDISATRHRAPHMMVRSLRKSFTVMFMHGPSPLSCTPDGALEKFVNTKTTRTNVTPLN